VEMRYMRIQKFDGSLHAVVVSCYVSTWISYFFFFFELPPGS